MWIVRKILCRNFYNCILRCNVVILKSRNFRESEFSWTKIRCDAWYSISSVLFRFRTEERKPSRFSRFDRNSNRNNSPRDTRWWPYDLVIRCRAIGAHDGTFWYKIKIRRKITNNWPPSANRLAETSIFDEIAFANEGRLPNRIKNTRIPLIKIPARNDTL